jgi:hypothetical protein
MMNYILKAILLATFHAIIAFCCSMKFNNIRRTGFLMKPIDILRNYGLQPA